MPMDAIQHSILNCSTIFSSILPPNPSIQPSSHAFFNPSTHLSILPITNLYLSTSMQVFTNLFIHSFTLHLSNRPPYPQPISSPHKILHHPPTVRLIHPPTANHFTNSPLCLHLFLYPTVLHIYPLIAHRSLRTTVHINFTPPSIYSFLPQIPFP